MSPRYDEGNGEPAAVGDRLKSGGTTAVVVRVREIVGERAWVYDYPDLVVTYSLAEIGMVAPVVTSWGETPVTLNTEALWYAAACRLEARAQQWPTMSVRQMEGLVELYDRARSALDRIALIAAADRGQAGIGAQVGRGVSGVTLESLPSWTGIIDTLDQLDLLVLSEPEWAALEQAHAELREAAWAFNAAVGSSVIGIRALRRPGGAA